jgi:hypothetical protein
MIRRWDPNDDRRGLVLAITNLMNHEPKAQGQVRLNRMIAVVGKKARILYRHAKRNKNTVLGFNFDPALSDGQNSCIMIIKKR